MVVLVACETLLLVALTVLVVGLLRSHAEILRRLGPPPDDGSAAIPDRPAVGRIPQPERRASVSAGQDLVGMTPGRDALKVGLGEDSPPTLLAFLSSGCGVCDRFWEDLHADSGPSELASHVRLVAVTKGPHEESPSRIQTLAPEGLPVVMSSAAWQDYQVPAAPYFVYVERGEVRGQGSASSWRGISSLLRDAIEDHAYENAGERRTADVDRVLMAAGIGPGHPSLSPQDRPEEGPGEPHPSKGPQ